MIRSIDELEAGEVQPSSTLTPGVVQFYHSLSLPIHEVMAQGDMHALGHSDDNQDHIITSGPTFDVEDNCNNSPDGHPGGISLEKLKDNSPAVRVWHG